MIVKNLSILEILLIGSILSPILISCGEVGDNNPNVSSSSFESSGNERSSSSQNVQGGNSNGNINNYKSVNIGNQTWMAENLNYSIEGSKCYNNDPENCKKYGRLYNWATAMALSVSCNSSECASQIQPKHRGICPSGWHLPNDAEWTILTSYVGSDAGNKLKARGWNSIYDKATDDYGFSALPGGFGFSDGSFNNVGDYGYWWSATERNSDYAYDRDMYYVFSSVDKNDIIKSRLFSVRCVKD